jgi:Domain of unknown function (DUF397)
MTSNDLRNLSWRKSSFSNGQANCVEIAFAWRKSSYSNSDSNCVEVAGAGPDIAVRDSKHPDGPVLVFAAAQWRAFTAGAAAGEFDPR